MYQYRDQYLAGLSTDAISIVRAATLISKCSEEFVKMGQYKLYTCISGSISIINL